MYSGSGVKILFRRYTRPSGKVSSSTFVMDAAPEGTQETVRPDDLLASMLALLNRHATKSFLVLLGAPAKNNLGS